MINPKELTLQQILDAEKSDEGQYLNEKKQFFIFHNAIYKKDRDKYILLTPTKDVFSGEY